MQCYVWVLRTTLCACKKWKGVLRRKRNPAIFFQLKVIWRGAAATKRADLMPCFVSLSPLHLSRGREKERGKGGIWISFFPPFSATPFCNLWQRERRLRWPPPPPPPLLLLFFFFVFFRQFLPLHSYLFRLLPFRPTLHPSLSLLCSALPSPTERPVRC